MTILFDAKRNVAEVADDRLDSMLAKGFRHPDPEDEDDAAVLAAHEAARGLANVKVRLADGRVRNLSGKLPAGAEVAGPDGTFAEKAS